MSDLSEDGMKRPMLVDGSVVTKTVTLRAEDVFTEIHTRTNKIITQFGDRFKPIRILLGPNEWLLCSNFIRSQPYAFGIKAKQGGFAYPDSILGYPVGLKRTPGLEFEFSPDCVMEFAHGRLESP